MKLVASAAIVVAAATLLSSPAQAAPACPDVDVVFARGTDEPPGVGVIGQAFVDALRSDTDKIVSVYPVNYPASKDYATAVIGVVDADNHVRDMTANCPSTAMVLGGYSQGAGVIAVLTSDGTTDASAVLPGLPGPLTPEVADRVAATALFGKPSANLLRSLDMPQLTVGPQFANKTIDLCVDDDPICSGGQQDGSIVPHLLYGVNGMASQAADFAAKRL